VAFSTEIHFKKRFKAACPFDIAFDVLADVPYSVEHFPKVEELVDLGDETYLWKMEKIGLAKYFIQTIYTCQYVWDKDKGIITWEPVEGEGNAEISGAWKLKPLSKTTTQVSFETWGELSVPLPALIRAVFGPLVVKEFEGLLDTYFANLRETFKELAGE